MQWKLLGPPLHFKKKKKNQLLFTTILLNVNFNETIFMVSLFNFQTRNAVCTRFIGMSLFCSPKNTIADEALTLLSTLRRGCCLYPPRTRGLSATSNEHTRSSNWQARRYGRGLIQRPRGCLMVLIVAVVFGDLKRRLISIGLQSLPPVLQTIERSPFFVLPTYISLAAGL